MRKQKIVQLNENEILNQDEEVKELKLSPEVKEKLQEEFREKVKKAFEKKEEDVIDTFNKLYNDNKIRFAKVNWGAGRGPYILAFNNFCDYNYCDCNSHEFKPLKDNEIKLNHVHIWECGNKLPEEINKLPTLNMSEYKDSLKEEKQKKKELKEVKDEN